MGVHGLPSLPHVSRLGLPWFSREMGPHWRPIEPHVRPMGARGIPMGRHGRPMDQMGGTWDPMGGPLDPMGDPWVTRRRPMGAHRPAWEIHGIP